MIGPKRFLHTLGAIALAFATAASGQGADVAPLWGALEHNNNNCGDETCSRIREGFADQVALCRDYDAYERENAQWAAGADNGGCVIDAPQPDPRTCTWTCGAVKTSALGVRQYCGSFEPWIKPVWDEAQRRYVCVATGDDDNVRATSCASPLPAVAASAVRKPERSASMPQAVVCLRGNATITRALDECTDACERNALHFMSRYESFGADSAAEAKLLCVRSKLNRPLKDCVSPIQDRLRAGNLWGIAVPDATR